MYDQTTGEGGLFAKYVNTFLKIKQEVSVFPSECVSDESKWGYIRDYKEKEGIDLEYDKITINPGLRSLAKLCLNSFWGKFGQRLSLNNLCSFTTLNVINFSRFYQIPQKSLIIFTLFPGTLFK